MSKYVVYDLKQPIQYTDQRTCKAIEFRRPKGKEASKVFRIVSALMPLAKGGEIPENLADYVLDFVDHFAEIIGDGDFPIATISEQLDPEDIFAIAGEVAENFI